MKRGIRSGETFAAIALILLIGKGLAPAESPWDLQAVDADGVATHPKVGAAVEPANKVVVEGIALNATADYLTTGQIWQTYIQAESPDQGGIAAFAAIFYDSTGWPRYPLDIEPGDRIRVEGYVTFHNGKTNINERHSAAPDLRFTVTKLASGVGMPVPQDIPSIDACNDFDATRATGGERWQCQWVRLSDVHIVSGVWAAGQTLTITDSSGETLDMLLSSEGDFDDYPAPTGNFTVVGIFDQEDTTAPYTEGYRLWVRACGDISGPSGVSDWALFR